MNRAARSKTKRGDGIGSPYMVRDELYRLEYPGDALGIPHAVALSSGERQRGRGETATDDPREIAIYHPVFLNG